MCIFLIFKYVSDKFIVNCNIQNYILMYLEILCVHCCNLVMFLNAINTIYLKII